MTLRFSQIHLPKLNPSCIAWSRQQETLTSAWIRGTCILITLNDGSLKLVDKFRYHYNIVSSTESDVNTHLTRVFTAIDRRLIIWKSNLSDKLKRDFSQAATVSVLVYEYTTWTLAKRIENKLDGNCTRILRTILNKSWKQHLAKQ